MQLQPKQSITRIYPQQDEEETLLKQYDEALHEVNQKYTHQSAINLEESEQEELTRYKSIWHWNQFLEFLFYHILFYILIGPFTAPLLYKFTGIHFMKNLRFWGFYQTFFLQSLLWTGQVLTALAYFNYMDSVVSITELVFMWFVIIVRSVIISAKYATLSPQRISLYKQYELTQDFFEMDLMMKDWRLQGPKILFLETLRALQRNEFESSLFFFDFLVPCSLETANKIKNTEIGFYDKWLKENTRNETQYDGFKVLGYLITQFQDSNLPYKIKFYSIIESVLLAISPVFIGLHYLISNPPNLLDVIRIILNGNTIMSALYGIFIFFHIALYDFQRKFFLIEQCLYLGSTRSIKLSSQKLLPTINVFNPQQLQSWSMFRTIVLTYGQTYTIRTQGFYSLVFLASIILFILGLCLILEFITMDLAQIILLGEIALVFLGFVTAYLYYGAILNGYFDEFRTLMEDLKSLFLDLQRLRTQYFSDSVQQSNYVHRKFVSLLQIKVGKTLNPDQVKETIQLLVQELNDNIRLIEYDQRNNPFKLYGVIMTFNLLKSAAVGLSTVLSYALQQKFTTKQN